MCQNFRLRLELDYSRLLVYETKTEFHPVEVESARMGIKGMESEAQSVRLLASLETSVDPLEIEKALSRAAELGLPGTGPSGKLPLRAKALRTQVPLVEAMKSVLHNPGKDPKQLKKIYAELQRQQLDSRLDQWVPELQAKEMAKKVCDLAKVLDAPKDNGAKASPQGKKHAHFEDDTNEDTDKNIGQKRGGERRRTITGMSAGDQETVLARLLQAAQDYDAPALEEGLSQATREGVEDPAMEEARFFLSAMQTEVFLSTAMEEVSHQAAARGVAADDAIRRLANLAAQAERLGIALAAAAEARSRIQLMLRRQGADASRHGLGGNVELMDQAFSDVSRFKGLRRPSAWKGHRSKGFFSRGHRGAKVMLNHSNRGLKESLTKLPRAQDARAVQIFSDILGWMCDRPVAESQRLGLEQSIVDAAASDEVLADEVYIQVMKQLSENPSERSAALGWQLMQQLCEKVLPSEDLECFVDAFLVKETARGGLAALQSCGEGGGAAVGAGSAAAAARCTAARRQALADSEKHQGNLQDLQIPVRVLLLDGSVRRIRSSKHATLENLRVRLVRDIGLHRSRDFSFYQITDRADGERLLPDSTTLETLSQRWDSLGRRSSRGSHLLFKRRSLRVGEELDSGDMVHATLTYQQALFDYFRYPFLEDEALLCAIAAMLMYIDRGRFRDVIVKGVLPNAATLEQVLPRRALGDDSGARFAVPVREAALRVKKVTRPGESTLAQMNRVMLLLQRMRLFGANLWISRQLTAPPASASGALALDPCVLNPRDPEAEYMICVDPYGVRFVALGGTPGGNFMRAFVFAHQGGDRIIRWEAEGGVLLLVVEASDPTEQPPKPRQMRLALRCPGAGDVAYAMHAFSGEQQGSRHKAVT